MITILAVVGTRPEVIKMAPVLQALDAEGARARTVLCSTGQHRELVDQALRIFDLRPDVSLDVMRPNQTLSQLTARLAQALDGIVRDVRPDWIVAQGDTTSVMVSAMTAYYHRVAFAHVEAGLRTGDLASPFPEEMNRLVADRLSTLMFAPTARARQNLLDEGLADAAIHVTGNTIVDALLAIATRGYDWAAGPLASVPENKRLVLVTLHRRESFGDALRCQCEAVAVLADRYAQHIHVVWPIHPNPNVLEPVRSRLARSANVTLVAPLDYVSQVQLMKRATLILTDSGGIQEEAPTFGVPVLVLREKTERPEGIEAGVAKLIGSNPVRIVAEASALLDDPAARAAMSGGVNPYGDGRAAGRIVSTLLAQ
jgi:UDP-N-acetylglucosamine 2-epimerase (non-hydrolysing)